MSRVSALLGKRSKNASVDAGKGNNSKEDGGASSTTSTPEKEKGNGGTLYVQRSREPSVTANGSDSPSMITSNTNRAPIRRQASSSSMVVQHTTADGTPVVFDTTTDANQSPQLAEGSLNSRSNSNRRSTFSRGGPALILDTARLPRSTSVSNGAHNDAGQNGVTDANSNQSSRPSSAYQPVGEGSLSLDAFLQGNQDSAVTPRAGHMQFSEELLTTSETPKPQLFVTDASPLPSPVPGMGASQSRKQADSRYPPVFEVSDRGSSSSSSATSAGEGDGSVVRPAIQLQRTRTNESDTSQHAAVHVEDRSRSRSLGPTVSSLSPPSSQASTANTRGRSASGASTVSYMKSSISPSSSRSSTVPTKQAKPYKKGSHGIAGALALSGVALASPAPGVAHPFQMVRTASMSKQRGTSEDDHLHGGLSRNDTSHPSPGDMPAFASRSSEETGGYESPTPLSTYTPNDSPRYEDDPAFQAMVSIDALGEFDDVVTQLGAGYALASSKRNAEFHSLFKHVPEEDYLIEDYGCALQREILIQGRLYISEHRLCFYANIFGWVTTLVLHFSEIVTIEKRNTALVIPNAIHIATMHSRHIFASFISRDMTYELITSLWKSSHPVVPPSAALPDTAHTEDDEDDFALSNTEDLSAAEQANSRKKRKMRKGRFKKTKAASGSVEAALDDQVNNSLEVPVATEFDNVVAGTPQPRASLGTSQLTRLSQVPTHPPTQCDCLSKKAGHYPNVIMDATFPGSPEKLYNLMFTSGFMRNFLIKDMKVSDLQYGDWAPQESVSHLLTRTYNYIKPLTAAIGPKSAKCVLTDENLHVDFDNFVVNMTTTRTPDVPSGGSFAVKTKTCLTWGRSGTARVLVTTTVEWTGRSFIRGVIDRSSLDGQKQLYTLLESSIRAYISAHRTEFYEAGDKDDDDDEVIHQTADDSGHHRNLSSGSAAADASDSDAANAAPEPPSKQPLAFVSNCIPLFKPICDFLSTLYDTLADLMGQMSPSTLVCAFIIAVLFASNIFTLFSLRKSSSRYIPQRRPPPNSAGRNSVLGPTSPEGQQQVADAVRGVLHEYFNLHNTPPGATTAPLDQGWRREAAAGAVSQGQPDKILEAAEIRTLLETLERRVAALKSTLEELD